jgi:hypothetical protein
VLSLQLQYIFTAFRTSKAFGSEQQACQECFALTALDGTVGLGLKVYIKPDNFLVWYIKCLTLRGSWQILHDSRRPQIRLDLKP